MRGKEGRDAGGKKEIVSSLPPEFVPRLSIAFAARKKRKGGNYDDYWSGYGIRQLGITKKSTRHYY